MPRVSSLGNEASQVSVAQPIRCAADITMQTYARYKFSINPPHHCIKEMTLSGAGFNRDTQPQLRDADWPLPNESFCFIRFSLPAVNPCCRRSTTNRRW